MNNTIKIKITNGTFYNTRHPTATPSRVIRVGDIFEVDSIGVDGHARYRATYRGVARNIILDSMYWSFTDEDVTEVEESGGLQEKEGCVCDIMVLMSVGCKCGAIEIERGWVYG